MFFLQSISLFLKKQEDQPSQPAFLGLGIRSFKTGKVPGEME